MDLPPGFAVGPGGSPQAPIVEAPGLNQTVPLGPVPAPAAPDGAAPPDATDQQGAAPPANPNMQQAALEAPPPPPEVSPLPMPDSETGSITLPQVPLPELVEDSQYGRRTRRM